MKLYKCRLIAQEYGLAVLVQEFEVLYETECYYWYSKSFINALNISSKARSEGITAIRAANLLEVKINKAHKVSSRSAFTTKEAALEHLKLLKVRQLAHMKRETAFVTRFLEEDDFKLSEKLDETPIKYTEDLVDKFVRFD